MNRRCRLFVVLLIELHEQQLFRHHTVGGCVDCLRDSTNGNLDGKVTGYRSGNGTKGRAEDGRCDADQAGGREALRDYGSHAGELDDTGLCAVFTVREGCPIQSRGRADACAEVPPGMSVESVRENEVFGALPALRARGSGTKHRIVGGVDGTRGGSSEKGCAFPL
jgi:hypothetical protein